MTPPKNILIVRTDRIGDVVLSLPLASIIKNKYPNSKITFLVSEYTKALAENSDSIDEVIPLISSGKGSDFYKNVLLIENKFDACVVAFPTFKIALILFLSNIKVRIGTGYRWYSFLFNKKIYDHRKYGEKHELEFNVRLLKHLGIDENINEENVSFKLHSDNYSRQKVEDTLAQLNISSNSKIVIIHPGSGGSAVDLPFNKLKPLVERMAHELSCEILITGGLNEMQLCESLIINSKTKSLAGKFNLAELIAVIEKSHLLIANSTGPIHIGAALGKKIIGFYPKIKACSPKRWGPFTKNKIIFTPAIDCDNCTKEQCKKLNCMDSINIDKVFDSAKKFLTDGV